MFILLSALKSDPNLAIPVLRKDTQVELIAVIENESRIDTATGKAEWVPTSQLAMFMHPSEIQEAGGHPIQEVPAATEEEWVNATVAHAIEHAKAEWAQFMSIPTKLDRSVTQEESGIDFAEIAKLAVSVNPADPTEQLYYTCDYDHATYALAEPQPKVVEGVNQDDTDVRYTQYFVKHPDGSFSKASPNPAPVMDWPHAPGRPELDQSPQKPTDESFTLPPTA